MNAAVSVVIPTFNGREHIRAALQSVVDQTIHPLETIVVDDASPDGTADVVEAFARSSPVPIRLIRLETNSGGPAHPLNVGIGAARGDLIAVLDQDDLFLPNKLADQAGVLARDPDVTFVFSFCGWVDHGPRPRQDAGRQDDLLKGAERREGYSRIRGSRSLFLLLKHGTFVVGYPAFMFRRRDWLTRGGLDEAFAIASDFEWLCWLSTRGWVAVVPTTVCQHRDDPRSLSADQCRAGMEMGTALLRYFEPHLRNLADHGDLRELRAKLLEWAYWMRVGGEHRTARRLYRLSAQHTGWNASTLRDVAKLYVHWTRAGVGRVLCA